MARRLGTGIPAVLVGALLALAGCKSHPLTGDAAAPMAPAQPAPAPAEPFAATEGGPALHPGETAREAAMQVAMLPPPADAATRQEILLWVAFYQAAYRSNVGESTRHFVLEMPVDAQLPAMSVSRDEFQLRVLAGLAGLNVPVAWMASEPPGQVPEYFPGTRERATLLRFRVLSRRPGQATVIAEIGDATADAASSRQNVTAVWDGEGWNLRPEGAKMVW